MVMWLEALPAFAKGTVETLSCVCFVHCDRIGAIWQAVANRDTQSLKLLLDDLGK
jgi:hypothetical protein